MSRRIVLVDIGNAMVLRGVLPSVAVGASYGARVTASGGAAPYTYTITAGADALTAAGIQLDPATGVFSASSVSGAGNIPITVRATGINGAYVQRQFVITVIAEPLILTITGTYPAATVGTPYSADLVITNGVQPYSNARVIAGARPSWATLEVVGDKLRLSGTPTAAATFDFTVAVDSAEGQTAASAQEITVAAASTATWSQTFKSASVVLSEANRVAEWENDAQYRSVMSDIAKSSGRWYAEIQMLRGSSSVNYRVGLASEAQDLSASVGAGANAWVMIGSNGECYHAGGFAYFSNSANDINQGEAWAVAYDASAGKLWLSKAGTNDWRGGGNPAQGTTPSYAVPAGLRLIASSGSGLASKYRLLQPGEILGSMPAGFKHWGQA